MKKPPKKSQASTKPPTYSQMKKDMESRLCSMRILSRTNTPILDSSRPVADKNDESYDQMYSFLIRNAENALDYKIKRDMYSILRQEMPQDEMVNYYSNAGRVDIKNQSTFFEMSDYYTGLIEHAAKHHIVFW